MMKLMTPLLAIILSLGVAGQVHAAGVSGDTTN